MYLIMLCNLSKMRPASFKILKAPLILIIITINEINLVQLEAIGTMKSLFIKQ